MSVINRSAVIIRPLPPYLAWAKQDDTTNIAERVFEDLRTAPHVYLLPEYEDAESEREVLEDFWPELFAAMLNCWLTDEQQWPKKGPVGGTPPVRKTALVASAICYLV